MLHFLHRKRCSFRNPLPLAIEILEDRRLLSADFLAPGMQVTVPRHVNAVNMQLGNLDLGLISAENVASTNPVGPSAAATVDFGRGKSAIYQEAFISNNPDGTRELFTVNPVGQLPVGNHPLKVTITEDGVVAATLVRVVHVVPRTANGLALRAVAGKPFTGTVGFLDAAPGADQTLALAWGDGMTDVPTTVTTADKRVAVQGTHTYTNPGNYVVSVTRTTTAGTPTSAVNIEYVMVSTIHVRK